MMFNSLRLNWLANLLWTATQAIQRLGQRDHVKLDNTPPSYNKKPSNKLARPVVIQTVAGGCWENEQ